MSNVLALFDDRHKDSYVSIFGKCPDAFVFRDGKLIYVNMEEIITALKNRFPLGYAIHSNYNDLITRLVEILSPLKNIGTAYIDPDFLFLSLSDWSSPNFFCAKKDHLGIWVGCVATMNIRNRVKLLDQLTV